MLSTCLKSGAVLAMWAAIAAADFQLYRYYEADALIEGLGVSRQCLAAL
jgi:hypothetical protein